MFICADVTRMMFQEQQQSVSKLQRRTKMTWLCFVPTHHTAHTRVFEQQQDVCLLIHTYTGVLSSAAGQQETKREVARVIPEALSRKVSSHLRFDLTQQTPASHIVSRLSLNSITYHYNPK